MKTETTSPKRRQSPRVRCPVCGTLNARDSAQFTLCPPCFEVAIPCADIDRDGTIEDAFARARVILADPDGHEAQVFALQNAYRRGTPETRAFIVAAVEARKAGRLAGLTGEALLTEGARILAEVRAAAAIASAEARGLTTAEDVAFRLIDGALVAWNDAGDRRTVAEVRS